MDGNDASEDNTDDGLVGEEGYAPCPQCGESMVAIRGRKDAVCNNCGFKDSCCY